MILRSDSGVSTDSNLLSPTLQGKISEIELRLYLASSGCNSYDVEKLTTLFKNLIRTERNDFVTFFDFVRSYDWIAQAFRIYSVPA